MWRASGAAVAMAMPMGSIHHLFFVIVLALALILPIASSVPAFRERLNNHANFIVAHGWGPDRWGCSFTRTQVHETSEGTKITIGKDSALKPYSCGELIYRQKGLGYGQYSIDMIASSVVGQVTSFFLISDKDNEIDIELTGLNNRIAWMNVWANRAQNPVSIDLGFDASKDWHNYRFDWHRSHIAWFVDDVLVLNRSDVPTTDPTVARYTLAINSWTQVQPEINIEWAGKFRYPNDGSVPNAMFRNMAFQPSTWGSDLHPSSNPTPPSSGDDNSGKEPSPGNQDGDAPKPPSNNTDPGQGSEGNSTSPGQGNEGNSTSPGNNGNDNSNNNGQTNVGGNGNNNGNPGSNQGGNIDNGALITDPSTGSSQTGVVAPKTSSAEVVSNPANVLAISASAMVGVALAFTILC